MRSVLANRFGETEFRELLGNRTFLRLYLGRVVTDTGDTLYFIGTMWLVWELTGSTLYTGLAGALVQVPNALNFLVGPLVDRWDLRPVLLATQTLNGVGVLLVPAAAAVDRLSVWLLLALVPVLTFVNGFVYPAQNAALPQIVDEKRLTRANSLFSTSLQAVNTVGRALAGALIAAVGAVALFVVDGVTFAVAAVLFTGVTVTDAAGRDSEGDTPANEDGSDGVPDDAAQAAAASGSDDAGGSADGQAVKRTDQQQTERGDGRADEPGDGGYWDDLRSGIDYLRGSTLLRGILGIAVVNFVIMAAGAILPAFADATGGSALYGLLMAALAAGNVVGSGGAFLVEDYPIGVVATVGFALSGASWLGAVAVPGVGPTLALFLLAAIFVGVFNVLFFTMIQTAVEDVFLGRVSSVARTLRLSLAPAGAFLGGVAGGVTSPTTVMYAVGGVLFALGLLFLLHPGLRSIPKVEEADATVLGLGAAPDPDGMADSE